MYEQSSDWNDGAARRWEHAANADAPAVSAVPQGLDTGVRAAADQSNAAIRANQPAAVGTGKGDGPADAGAI